MATEIFRCEQAGRRVEVISPVDDWCDISFSQFCIVKRYELLYEEALPQFGEDTPYALPGKSKAPRVYNGIDREPDDFTLEDMDLYSTEEVLKYYRELNNPEFELLFYKMSGYDCRIPEGLEFIGFDVGFTYGKGHGDGFSAICDCMYICRWHGCDEDGTEFTEEFRQLNENGLFDSKEQAVDYLYHYLSQSWAECGEFCVFEIYKPTESLLKAGEKCQSEIRKEI